MASGEEIKTVGDVAGEVEVFPVPPGGSPGSVDIERSGPQGAGGVRDPGRERDAYIQADAKPAGRVVPFNRSIARLKIDPEKPVAIFLDYTDTFGPQNPNDTEFAEVLRRLTAVLDILQQNSHVSFVALWGTFPLEVRVRASALRRRYPKLLPSVSSPEKNLFIANRDGVVNKKRLSRPVLEDLFGEPGLSHNLVVVDNGETLWPFHLAGLAQVVVPDGKNNAVGCVRQLVAKLNHAYERPTVAAPAPSDDMTPFAVALRTRVGQLTAEGKAHAALFALRSRIHTRDLADFLHPYRIRFVFADPELRNFVAGILELESMGSLPVPPLEVDIPVSPPAETGGSGSDVSGPTGTGGGNGDGPGCFYPDFSSVAGDLPSKYDAETGFLVIPAKKPWEKEARIDLNIPGLPRCSVEMRPSRNRHGVDVNIYTLKWGAFFQIRITYDPFTRVAYCEKRIKGAEGSYIYIEGRGDQVKRAWEVPSLGEKINPFSLEDLEAWVAGFRKDVHRKLIESLAKSPREVGAAIRRYVDLGDRYEGSVITRHGIRSWADLEIFIRQALRNAKPGQSVEIEVEERFLDALQPPPEFSARVAAMMRRFAGRPLTLAVKGNPIDRPTIYRFARDGIHTSVSEPDRTAIAFWDRSGVKRALANHFSEHPEDAALLEALNKAETEVPQGTLGDLLERTIETLDSSAKADGNDKSIENIPPNRRTGIYRHLDAITERLKQTVERIIQEADMVSPPGALYWDPVSTLLRRHPASGDPRHHAVILGGGQMGAAWAAWIRGRIDTGETVEINGVETKLPLDARITVVEWSEALVDEMDRKGINRVAYGDLQINPDDRVALYYLPLSLRNKLLADRPAKMVIFALKADQLVAKTEDPEFVALLRKYKPAMPTPAKSFVPGNLIPFGALLQRWAELGAIDLADMEVVNGGYEKGSSIINAALGIDKGDGELFMIFVAESQEAIDITRAFFGDRNITYARGRELALLVQAASALKNISTYAAGQIVMQRLLGKEAPNYADLQRLLDAEITDNIELIEETIARIAPLFGIATYHLSLPYEVEMDVRKCLALKLKDLLSIRSRFEALMEQGNFAALDKIIAEIVDPGAELGGGTRNPRDGLIDGLLFTAYHAFLLRDIIDAEDGDVLHSFVATLKNEGRTRGYAEKEIDGFVNDITSWAEKAKSGVIPREMTFEDFIKAHYPGWRQEGRNARGPLTDYADKHRVALPTRIIVASNLYREGEAREMPVEYRQRELKPEDHPLWGIQRDRIQKLGEVAESVRSILSKQISRGEEISGRFLAVGFARLAHAIKVDVVVEGAYPEINNRLLAIREGAEILIELLCGNHIEDQRMAEGIKAFQETLNEACKLTTESDQWTLSLRLRTVIKQLYAVEKAICEDLARLGEKIDPRRERRSAAVTPFRVVSGAVGIGRPQARGDVANSPVASGRSPVQVDVPAQRGGSQNPQNSIITSGAFYAGIPLVDGANVLATAPPQVFLEEPKPQARPHLELIEGGLSEEVAEETEDVEPFDETQDRPETNDQGQEIEDLETEATADNEAAAESDILPSATGLPSNILFYPGVSPTTMARVFARVI